MVGVLKKKNQFLLGVETVLCFLAVAAPLAVRYHGVTEWTRAVSTEAGFKLVLYTVILWLAIFLNDLYHIRVLTDKRRLLPRLAKGWLVAVVLYALASAVLPDLTQGRLVFGTALGTITFLLLVQYKYFRPTLERRLRKERVLVLGDSAIGKDIREELTQRDYRQTLIESPDLIRRVMEWVYHAGAPGTGGLLDRKALDERLEQIKSSVDVVVLALENVPFPLRWAASLDGASSRDNLVALEPFRRQRSGDGARGSDELPTGSGEPDTDVASLMRGLVALKLCGVNVIGGLDYWERLTGRVYLGEPAGPLFFSQERYTIDKLTLATKDMWERLLALVIFCLSLPFLVLVPLAILIDSGRPLLFVQKRVGRGGRVYKLYKWRSMTSDGKVTRVGRIIRKTKLDELPQLVNVLLGQMSLVGPRPELPEYVRKFAEADCYYNLRHIVKPGLTGWAQIMFPDARAEHARTKLSYDLFYVKHFSLVSDMVIMIETFKMIVFRNRMKYTRRAAPGPTDPAPPDDSEHDRSRYSLVPVRSSRSR